MKMTPRAVILHTIGLKAFSDFSPYPPQKGFEKITYFRRNQILTKCSYVHSLLHRKIFPGCKKGFTTLKNNLGWYAKNVIEHLSRVP